MTALLAVEDVADALGGIADDDVPVLDRDITLVEALLLAQCGRTARVWQAAQTARVEVLGSSAASRVVLDYPVAALTSVVLGLDPLVPAETLIVNDQTKLSWSVGSRLLERVDGGTFGGVSAGARPRYVHVTYNAAADLPLDAQLAVQSVVITRWHRRGNEEATSERIGGYQAEYAQIAAGDPLWQAVLRTQWEPNVG